MWIPKYWAKSIQTVQGTGGRTATFLCWQWSDQSPEDARRKAEDRARQIAQKILNRETLNRYGYGDRPLREEVLQAITNSAGQQIAVITRNAYGAQVLNTASAMFIDIDFPEAGKQKPPAQRGWLFNRQPSGPSNDPESVYTQKVADWAASRRDLGIRVYRTLAGLRCLITNQLFDPTQGQTLDMMRELESDPLYIRLCQAQECFRARLTPKPWRCGAPQPPTTFPWESTKHELDYRQWERRYDQASAGYITCRLVMRLGPETIHPDVLPIVSVHDRYTCADPNGTLA